MIKLGTNYITAKELSSYIKVRFEDVDTWIPVGYDGYLKRRYGNYMQLPPEYRRRGHHSDNNFMQSFSLENPKKLNDLEVADPFNPCEHSEIRYWKKKIQS